MSDPQPQSQATKLGVNSFEVVEIETAKVKKHAILMNQLDDKGNLQTEVIAAIKPAALDRLQPAIVSANDLVDSGRETTNPKLVTDHHAFADIKADKLNYNVSPAMEKAALKVLEENRLSFPDTKSQDAASKDHAQEAQKSYRYDRKDIPDYILKTVRAKLGEKAQVVPPQEGSKYKGAIVYEDKTYAVQGVFKKTEHGYEMHNAIAHKKTDLEFVSDKQKWRAENRRLGGQELHVIYTDLETKGKAYPYSLQKEIHERSLKTAEKAFTALPPEQRGPAMEALKAAQHNKAPATPKPEQQPALER